MKKHVQLQSCKFVSSFFVILKTKNLWKQVQKKQIINLFNAKHPFVRKIQAILSENQRILIDCAVFLGIIAYFLIL